MNQSDIELLKQLLAIDSPSGDEGGMADWLTDWIGVNVALPPEGISQPLAEIVRLRDCLVVTKGPSPKVAVFAHTDTTGFTVGYGGELIPIGSPHPEEGDRVRIIGGDPATVGTLTSTGEDGWTVTGIDTQPGDRLVYAAGPLTEGDKITSPYLDNRGGVWAALYALQECGRIAVAFTSGEETGASGAMICARYLYDTFGITKALISDITWDTEHVHCSAGVAISRRDRLVPSQWFVDQAISVAQDSGIAFQIEIESEGGSDGAGIERSASPIDWVFVGAPEERPHSATESLDLNDLQAMGELLKSLVDGLTAQGE